jgi:MFS family permease
MKTPLGATRTPARTRLSALGKLTVAAVIGLPLLLSTNVVINGLNVMNLLFAGIALILAAIITGIIVATRWRWSPLLGALLYVVMLALFIPIMPYALSHPNATYLFALNVVLLALAVVGIGAGIGATVQNYRNGERKPRAPRWLGVSLGGLAGLVAGMLIVSLIVAANPQVSRASINPNGEPVAHMALDHFVQNVVLVPKGSKLLIVNDSSVEHILQNGAWDANGTPHAGAESGAPPLRNIDITSGSRAIGPFAIAGVYHLYCTLHQGMNLTVVVQ